MELTTTILRAEAAEQEVRQILTALESHCKDDFIVITDGGIDWGRTIAEFVGFIALDATAPASEPGEG